VTVESDPEYVQAVVDVFSEVLRDMSAHPERLDAAAQEYLPDFPAERIQPYKDAYLGMDYWNPSLTHESVQTAIDFMVETGAVSADAAPAPEDIADLSFITNALCG
jgi:ABC-type nitrate/sulfonate/bicarbonate transport system substrate-binding protein